MRIAELSKEREGAAHEVALQQALKDELAARIAQVLPPPPSPHPHTSSDLHYCSVRSTRL